MIEALLILLAVVFAVNIGASGTAAAMGEVYGSGALGKRAALGLAAVFVLAGAVLAGGEVVRTIGSGVIGGEVITMEAMLVVLLCAVVPLFLANILGIPLSTSEVTVGALVGVGLALGSLHYGAVGVIVLSWVMLPVLASALAGASQRLLGHRAERIMAEGERPLLRRALSLLLIGGGSYAAFAAGANNTANAIGPLVGVGLLSSTGGLLLGGICLGLGALALGGRVLETNGRRITRLTLPGGISVTFTTASLVLAFSLVGIPVPLTQATTGAIVGVGLARSGRKVLYSEVVKKVVSVWVLSPAVSLALAYFLMNFLQGLQGDFATLALVALVSGMLAAGALFLRLGTRGPARLRGLLAHWQTAMGVHNTHPKTHPASHPHESHEEAADRQKAQPTGGQPELAGPD